MRILLLGPKRPSIIRYLQSYGDSVLSIEDKISTKDVILNKVQFIISFGYRHILKNDILSLFPKRAINLHISLLPWNRGADPNLWSFLEDTPKGVTIHYLDTGIDTGEIIVQETVQYYKDDTLKTMYTRLSEAIEELFKMNWLKIRDGQVKSTPQLIEGSFHKLSDRKLYEHLLISSWDTPVVNLLGKALGKEHLSGIERDKNC